MMPDDTFDKVTWQWFRPNLREHTSSSYEYALCGKNGFNYCSIERELLSGPCGIKGKLWETIPKE